MGASDSRDPRELALAQADLQLARRCLARCERYLSRADLGGIGRLAAEARRDELTQEISLLESVLAPEPPMTVRYLVAFGALVPYLREEEGPDGSPVLPERHPPMLDGATGPFLPDEDNG